MAFPIVIVKILLEESWRLLRRVNKVSATSLMDSVVLDAADDDSVRRRQSDGAIRAVPY